MSCLTVLVVCPWPMRRILPGALLGSKSAVVAVELDCRCMEAGSVRSARI